MTVLMLLILTSDLKSMGSVCRHVASSQRMHSFFLESVLKVMYGNVQGENIFPACNELSSQQCPEVSHSTPGNPIRNYLVMTVYLVNIFNLCGHVVCLVIGCNKSISIILVLISIDRYSATTVNSGIL